MEADFRIKLSFAIESFSPKLLRFSPFLQIAQSSLFLLVLGSRLCWKPGAWISVGAIKFCLRRLCWYNHARKKKLSLFHYLFPNSMLEILPTTLCLGVIQTHQELQPLKDALPTELYWQGKHSTGMRMVLNTCIVTTIQQCWKKTQSQTCPEIVWMDFCLSPLLRLLLLLPLLPGSGSAGFDSVEPPDRFMAETCFETRVRAEGMHAPGRVVAGSNSALGEQLNRSCHTWTKVSYANLS